VHAEELIHLGAKVLPELQTRSKARVSADEDFAKLGKYLGVRAEQIHKIMDMFHHAEWFVIPFFVGSNIVGAISGISRVPARRLAVLLSIGLVVRLVFWWIIARIADEQIDTVLDFLNKYQTPALIASVVLTVVFVGVNLRRGRNFEL